MPATAATIGKGTTLGHSTTSGGAYTTIGELVETNIPEVSVGDIEATHYTSPTSFFEYISAIWQDGSELPFKLNYTKAEETILRGIVGTPLFWKITLGQDGSVYAFPGYVKKLGGGAIPNKDKIEQQGTMKITGVITWTAGS